MIERVDRDAPEYAIYAIKFAQRDRSMRPEHFYRGHLEAAEPLPIAYYVWLLAGRGRVVVVDAGFTPEVASRRGDRAYLRSPIETMGVLGIAAQDVDMLVLTHLHYDHTGFVGAFPRADVILQRRELQYWSGPMAQRGENPHLVEPDDIATVRALIAGERGRLVDGDVEIAPDIHVHRVGGHTAGLQVVQVDHGGSTTVLASDASHFFDNIGADKPYSIVDHLPSMYEAFDWITERVRGDGSIVPGHDPSVLERYPAVPGLGRLVVRVG